MQKKKPLPIDAQTEKSTSKIYIKPSEKMALPAEKQKQLNIKLRNASFHGNNYDIIRLLKAGADMTAKGEYEDETALLIAAYHGHTQTCALLMQAYAEAGGDVKELITPKSRYNDTALHNAAKSWGNAETCALLIQEYAKAGGDVNDLIAAKNSINNTPLDNALRYDQRESINIIKSMELLANIINKEALSSFLKSFNECIAA
jgi:ankyrin repeat protein